MKKLIITSDDYGMSRAVNDAIDEGIAAGVITSTNVMVNMPFYEDAVKLQDTKASLGIHWNLTCGNPISDETDIPTLVTSTGEFYSYSEFRRRYRKHLISDKDIQRELVAQYRRYRNLLGKPEYWNTHENVHVDFKIYQLFVKVAKTLGIYKMRSHQRIYVKSKSGQSSHSKLWLLIEPAKAKLLDLWQYNAHKMGMASTDGRVCCLEDSDSYDYKYVLNNIKWKKKMVGEIAIHPATQYDSEYFGEMIENRMVEYRIATNPAILEMAKKADIEIVNFDAVKKRGTN